MSWSKADGRRPGVSAVHAALLLDYTTGGSDETIQARLRVTSKEIRFVEITGKTLAAIMDNRELDSNSLEAAGVTDDTIVRVSELGDIEVRRPHKWDLIGGLLGDYENRIKRQTGMEWV